MKIDFSAAVELAFRKAAGVAQSAGAGHIRPLDVLRGLLDEEEGQPMVLVLAAGAAPVKLRELFPPCAALDTEAASFPMASSVALILSQARELTRLHAAEGTIASDHLLLALLESDASARTHLENIGLDFAVLKHKIAPEAPPLVLDEPLDFAPAIDSMDTARVVDAAANRAREALRVLEDFTRFVRADALLTKQLKTMRHDLAEVLALLPAHLLLQARDTVHDVGTSLRTESEYERATPLAVAQANAKRLQEALRSLEEFGKVLEPTFGQAIERVRYQSYTLERALLGTMDVLEQLAHARLYVLVTEALCPASLVGTVREALAGGAQVIQLREKNDNDRTLLDKARDLRKMTRAAGALFIVNDRPDIALMAEADGVHLGQDDLPVREARRLLGPAALVGVSTHNLDQVRTALDEGASYIGIGPTFPSRTKDFGEFPGLTFVAKVAAATTLPAFVLGGVTPANVSEVLAAGGTRIAVSNAICAAEDPRAVAASFRQSLLAGRAADG